MSRRSTHAWSAAPVLLATVLATTLAGTVVGCAHPVPTAEAAAVAAADSDSVAVYRAPATLKVINHHWGDIEITVTHNGLTSRLGMVTASATNTLAIPTSWLQTAASITISARAFGGGASRGSASSFDSRPLIVRPGQQVELTLESGLQRSSISVY